MMQEERCFIFLQSNLLGRNKYFTAFWKLHKNIIRGCHGAAFYLYLTLSLVSPRLEIFILRADFSSGNGKFRMARGQENRVADPHAIRQKTLHYHDGTSTGISCERNQLPTYPSL
jgi:hypothetical protein